MVKPLWALKDVPGTNEIDTKRRCHRCTGSGMAVCEICGGHRQVLKGKDVFGKNIYARCDGCYGLGTRRCNNCSGQGWVS